MDSVKLKELLRKLHSGEIDPDSALNELGMFPYETLDGLKIDSQRAMRTGQPEVIYAPGKTLDELVAAMEALNSHGSDALATRVEPDVADRLLERKPRIKYFERERCAVSYLYEDSRPVISPEGKVAVICAGASDLPVAGEAKITCEILGAEVELISDVGVAGIHRLKSAAPAMRDSDCLIVIAGMEGALASVVAGLSSKPVIAVPTSTGYGASFDGLAALLGMLNSCAPGMAVVNIDNGYGAAAMAVRIARQSATHRTPPPDGSAKLQAEKMLRGQ